MKYLVTTLFLALSLNAAALEVGDSAPCVVVNQIAADGSESEHCIRDRAENQKFALVEFFSITCTDCQANLPKLRSLGLSVAATANTRMVSIDRNETAVRTYVDKNRKQLPFEIALDLDRDAKKAYGVVQTPTLFVLDENNKIVFKHSGILSCEDIETVQSIVAE